MSFIFPRSHLAGLTLSTAGSSPNFGVAAGQCTDDANTVIMNAASAFTKTTASFAGGTGNGALLDAGSIVNSQWYQVFAMQRPDTLAVDYGISTSALPTLPANYTTSRYIGSMLTDGSGQWKLFHQRGDEFLWDVSVNLTLATTAVAALATLPVPIGVQVLAQFSVWGASTATLSFVSSPDVSNQSPSVTGAFTFNTAGAGVDGTAMSLRTNTSAQIRHRSNQSDNLHVSVQGWIDRRGKDA